ncbi:two-component system, NtrC family, response regulator GlrR [Pseudoalteromonas rubra]|uniref:Two-component system, NtrC family, response regulator GlrR n=1 Tax=Pseudoalteromonas rubra TaxID=43658 RepID=A0A8T0C2K9_9GAMM|nr:sigma-54 dependent transcriptional regulator [Pseudoalteromonas rubra]KAF7781567.1 two-component system, NtrC family, response regulator GlrR [Pseudoalteromonas rubra]
MSYTIPPTSDTHTSSVLLVDDDPALSELLAIRLESHGFNVTLASSGHTALRQLASVPVDVVITDLRMDHMDGLALNQKLQTQYPGLPVIMMTAHGSIPDAVDAIEQGITAFITKPINSEELLAAIDKALPAKRAAQLTDPDNFHGLYHQSQSMRQLVQQIKAIAPSQANILIQGESGTGKEVTARAIHQASSHAQGPFIAINCGALPAHLLESELFGHKKGAFTGAISDKQGLIQSADKGTLLLDEIGDMPLDLQVKLLRVLQEKTVRPIGGQHEQAVDVRILSASHKNLAQAVSEGKFREDLYYRLNVVAVQLPALRERVEDIPLLANLFLKQLATGQKRFSLDATTALLSYAWPGNIRQLHNVVEYCVAMTPGKLVTADSIISALPEQDDKQAYVGLNEAKRQFERDYLIKVLALCENNVPQAAKLAQRNRSDFYKLMKKHDIK